MVSFVNVQFVKVNQLERMATISISQNHSIDKFGSHKRNHGFGQNYGDGTIKLRPVLIIDDEDVNDSFAIKINPE